MIPIRTGVARPFDELREEFDRLWTSITAPPVSPEVATKTLSVGSRGSRKRSKQAAKNRAPKSLKAAVGP